MNRVAQLLIESETPCFNNYIRPKEALKLQLDLTKLKFEIILDSQLGHHFEKSIQLDWKFALVITYDGKAGFVLSFDVLEDDWIIIRQLQWVKWWWRKKLWYKIYTSLDILEFYLKFFEINFILKWYNKIVVGESPPIIDNLSVSFIAKQLNSSTKYILFKTILDRIISIHN